RTNKKTRAAMGRIETGGRHMVTAPAPVREGRRLEDGRQMAGEGWAVRCDGVSLRYGETAQPGPNVLRDVGFAMREGSFRCLQGQRGAGKTGLLRLLTLSVRTTRGRLAILGTDIGAAARSDLPALRRRIGMVFQDFRLLGHLSTYDNVALPLRLAGRPEGQ